MRSFFWAAVLALAWTLAGSGTAYAAHWHLHCLTTPGGKHALAVGVTANASHTGFSKFHSNVHEGAFASNASTRVSISATSPTGTCQ